MTTEILNGSAEAKSTYHREFKELGEDKIPSERGPRDAAPPKKAAVPSKKPEPKEGTIGHLILSVIGKADRPLLQREVFADSRLSRIASGSRTAHLQPLVKTGLLQRRKENGLWLYWPHSTPWPESGDTPGDPPTSPTVSVAPTGAPRPSRSCLRTGAGAPEDALPWRKSD